MSENQDIPSSNGIVWDAESDPPENGPDGNQVNFSMSTGREKRNRESGNSLEAKGKAPKKRISGNEASTSRQQPKPKRGKKCGEAVNKVRNVRHQIDRRRKTDKTRDLEILTWMKLKAYPVSLRIPTSFKQIKTQWPMRPDLQSILKEIQEIEAKFKDNVLIEDEVMGRVDEVEDKLNKLAQQRSKEQKWDIDAVFSITEFCSAYPWLFFQDQDYGSLSTLEGRQSQLRSSGNQLNDENNISLSTHGSMQFQLKSLENQLFDENVSLSTDERIESQLRSLENQVYDENNNKVSAKDFEGLEEALKKTNAMDLPPNCFKPIANQIKEARGEATGTAHLLIEVFVCAAIKEMQCLKSAFVNWNTLKKWGATLNYARQNGFQVSFADELLEKNLKTYFFENYFFG